MSFGSLLEVSNLYGIEGAPVLNIPLSLGLVGLLVVLILLIYIHGNVIATIAVTLRPEPEALAHISRKRSRGFSIFILHRLFKIFFLTRFSVRGANLLYCFALNISAELLLSTLKVANVHAILNSNISIPIYRRVFSRSTWSRTFSAVLLYSTVSSTCFYLPACIIRLSDIWEREFNLSMEMQTCAILLIIAILYFGAVVPAYAIFIRVAAYTLPPGNYLEGKGNRPTSIMSAWNSLPSSNLLSFYKSLALVLAMEFGVTIVIFMLTLAHFPVYHHDDVAQLFVKYLG